MPYNQSRPPHLPLLTNHLPTYLPTSLLIPQPPLTDSPPPSIPHISILNQPNQTKPSQEKRRSRKKKGKWKREKSRYPSPPLPPLPLSPFHQFTPTQLDPSTGQGITQYSTAQHITVVETENEQKYIPR